MNSYISWVYYTWLCWTGVLYGLDLRVMCYFLYMCSSMCKRFWKVYKHVFKKCPLYHDFNCFTCIYSYLVQLCTNACVMFTKKVGSVHLAFRRLLKTTWILPKCSVGPHLPRMMPLSCYLFFSSYKTFGSFLLIWTRLLYKPI